MPRPDCRACGATRPINVLASSHCAECRTPNPYAEHLPEHAPAEPEEPPLAMPRLTYPDDDVHPV